MKRLFCLIVFILLTASGYIQASVKNHSDSLLTVLDKELTVRDKYISERKAKISVARQNLNEIELDNTDTYNVLRSLFSLYHTFDLDSALCIARMRLDIAEKLNDTHKIISAKLNVAESSIALGSYHSAKQLLDELDRDSMQDYHRHYAYYLYSKLYHNLYLSDAIPSKRSRNEALEKIYLDSLAMYPASKPVTSSRSLITEAEEARRIGKNETAKALLGEAVLIDVREGRRDMESLMQLANILCDEGDYNRSYRYITVALDEARVAGAQSRTAEILQAASIIEQAHNAMIEQSVRKMHTAMIVIAMLSLVAVTALIYVLILLRAKNRAAKTLKETNMELANANKMREMHISHLFNSYSSHIEQIMAFRKQCLRLLKAGKFPQLEKNLSASNMENTELQNMYASFDEIFLSMYPRFIEDYNTRVQEEFRIPPSTEGLTPELRVLALITLGITDSGSIARLLHYSPQTIYNYRSRLKLRLSNTL